MWAILLVSLSAAPPKIASLGLESVGVDRTLTIFLEERVAQRMSEKTGASVLTANDVRGLLGLERQKQLVGCSESAASCMTELAGALGATALLSGDIVKVGSRFSFSLKLLDTRTSKALFSKEIRVADELGLRRAADELGNGAADALLELIAPLEEVRHFNWRPTLLAVPGLIAGGVAAAFSVDASNHLQALRALGASSAMTGPSLDAQIASAALHRDDGQRSLRVATGLFVAGGAAVLSAIIWWAISPYLD